MPSVNCVQTNNFHSLMDTNSHLISKTQDNLSVIIFNSKMLVSKVQLVLTEFKDGLIIVFSSNVALRSL